MPFDAGVIFDHVREQAPVVHHITNWVTIYDCANIVKVFGASPVMAHAPEEVADMGKIASALVLNIGTLTSDVIAAMKIAALAANKKGIPVVLDVCGAGATSFRNKKCAELLTEVKINIIKGNASEIASVAGESVQTKGVDAGEVKADLEQVAKRLASEQGAVVVITGKEDIVSDGHSTYLVKNGTPLMARIVGTGCMATSVIGTFAAVERDLAKAAAAGLCAFEVAAEHAARDAQGPGSFKEKLFDAVYNLDSALVRSGQKIERI